ncbi:Small-conductance mechanosensitive channel [Noviherbaspirillum humi]|uniref:Small-conductance mechanosensitive channel n=1 Tax=Noviherbaspirillum humi TaxID=1688639 RepID=A0A239C4Y6_9BURK|nr:mechanosensitive ion channel family protein [Noviherbaspirillum humi]SNS15256.1 Small-conductance mechanosensitive channel [Noviherbaspirillum humi]
MPHAAHANPVFSSCKPAPERGLSLFPYRRFPMPDWSQTFLYAVMPWMVLMTRIPWMGPLVQILGSLFAVLVFHQIGTGILERLTFNLPYSRKLVAYGHRAGALVLLFLLMQIILRNSSDDLPGISVFRHLSALALIMSLTWLGVRCVRAVADAIIELNPATSADNLQARRIQTQTKVLARSLMVLIILLGSGTALMTLPLLRQIGTSLLASAGVAGLVVGFAAKPVLGNLLAGMQLALTQPIRLEDVVIVENEWGHIEEITGTYVVVRLWDQRRMVVPLQWFIEHPFQNWTRTSSDILGTVTLWVDYRMPVQAIREEAERICRGAPEWDGRLCLTQVVESGERAMQVRLLLSAADAGRSWDLRCRVREELIDFVQRHYPDYLPRTRAALDAGEHDAGPQHGPGRP